MTQGNGKLLDEGLMAINESFKDAKFLEAAAKDCAELMKIGAHRELELPDSVAMSMYGAVTEGKKFFIEHTNLSGDGYRANIQSYEDLARLFRGELVADVVTVPEAQNDG